MEKNRKSIKRLDTLYQLKLLMDTAIDETPIVFTKSVLVHKNKGSFDTYPFFAPYASYPRTVIEKMEYSDRVALFFTKKQFVKIIFGNKAKTKKRIEEEARHANDAEEWDLNQERLQRSNFEFTIQMLFCTAFPISDFFSRSFDYFSTKSFVDETWTFKDIAKSSIKSVTSLVNKAYFSYLTTNNQVYTISQVIWINDVFNHPLYSIIVNNYRKISEDQSFIEGARDKLLVQILLFVKQIYSNEVQKKEESKKPTMIIQNIEEIVKDQLNKTKALLNHKSYGNSLFQKTQYLDKTVKSIQNIRTALTDINIAKFNAFNDKDKEGTLDATKKTLEGPAKEVIGIVGDNLIGLRYLFEENILESKYKRFITVLLRTYEDIRVLENAIELVVNKEFKNLKIDDESDTMEEKEEKKKLNAALQKYFPQAIEFFGVLNRFAKERDIGNEKWNELVNLGITNKISELLDNLITCYDDTKCKSKDKPNEYIEVKLDKLLEKSADVKAEKLVEAYLQVSLVEGEVTEENYKNLKCKFLDTELANLWDNIRNPSDSWDITYEKQLLSLKDAIAETNRQTESQKKLQLQKKQNKPQKPKTQKKPKTQIQLGGRRISKKIKK